MEGRGNVIILPLKTVHLRNLTISHCSPHLRRPSTQPFQLRYGALLCCDWLHSEAQSALFGSSTGGKIKNPNTKHSSYSNEKVCAELNMSNHGIASWIWAQRTGSIRKLFCEQKFCMNFYSEDKRKP